MLYKKCTLAMISIFFITGNISAQDLGIGPQVGYYKAKDADGSFMFGAAIRMHITPALGVEGSINYKQESYDYVTVKSWPVLVTGFFYPIPIAYGSIGAGWYNTTLDYKKQELGNIVVGIKDKTTQEFGWHFGAGAELPVGSNTTLAGDIRYVFLDYDFEEIPGSDSINSNFYIITASLLFGL
ncbi:MAG: outer membrane beta-barrel protein [Calditrichae bacterium]|nr:outer membrane beta-barrel protein [Calditrichia bacterium]